VFESSFRFGRVNVEITVLDRRATVPVLVMRPNEL
jgi:hypothetical protein